MMMMKMLMVMMMVLIYIANQSYLVAVPAVLSLLLGRSFGLNMVPEPLEVRVSNCCRLVLGFCWKLTAAMISEN